MLERNLNDTSYMSEIKKVTKTDSDMKANIVAMKFHLSVNCARVPEIGKTI